MYYANGMPYSQQQLLEITNIHAFISSLAASGCTCCSLSQHDNGVVVSRGNPNAKIMLIGEGPGLGEDIEGKPFIGPAGQLLDKVMASIGVDTNRDCYLTNVVRCRPVAPPGYGKQNYTPIASQCSTCLPYLQREIELIKPRIIVSIGITPVKYLFGMKSAKMGQVAGHLLDVPSLSNSRCFALYHSAYILHCQKKGSEEVLKAKNLMWNHVRILKEIIRNEGIETSLQEWHPQTTDVQELQTRQPRYR